MNSAPQLTLRSVWRNLLDFLYPPLCQICRSSFESTDNNIWICHSCLSKLQWLPAVMCPVCRAPLKDPERGCDDCRRRAQYSWVYSLSIYDDKFSHLIKAFKYEGRVELGRYLGEILGEQLRGFPQAADIDTVLPVPIHIRKERKRGFNQTEIIAAAVARKLGALLVADQVIQARRNRDQIGLSVEERFRNVRDVFEVAEPFELYGKSVLVVDDVTTSGATLNSMAYALREAGARKIAAATLALALEDGVDPAELHQMSPGAF